MSDYSIEEKTTTTLPGVSYLRMQKHGFQVFQWVILLFCSAIIAVPFYIMFLTSFKTPKEIFSESFVFFPEKWTTIQFDVLFSNYIEGLAQGQWGLYFFNTAFVTGVTVVTSVVINSLAGYAFARVKFKGRDMLFFLSLLGIMIPPQTIMIPVFLIMKHIPLAGGNDIFGLGGFGWINSYMGLIAPYVAGSFGVFLFRQYYLNFPMELDDAARIDGVGRLRAYWSIYLPLSKPVLASLIALKSTHAWNEYTWPLIITNAEEMWTVQLALTIFEDEYQVQWHYLMALTSLIVFPLLIIFLFLNKYFVSGIATTGIKG